METAAVQTALQQALQTRYAIEGELGRGGMATVYLARDLRHGRAVAIKVLLPDLAAELGPERFLREIATTAALQHPHILPLHDSGEAGGLLYYVMPYVAGESLRSRLERERQLPLDEAVRIATQVALALDYAHRHGVVHRDVKPENVLLDEDGHALVADFGIARAVQKAAGSTTLTRSGIALGTPQYMSPEQASAEQAVDARTDVWALGCLLYEMLAGESPFAAPTAQGIVARVLAEDPRSLSAVRHTVPPHVAATVARALEKTPADRFATAAHFAGALASSAPAPTVTPTMTPTSTPMSTPAPTARRTFAGTRRDVLWAAVTVIALGAAVWGWRRPRTDPAAAAPPMHFVLELPESRQTGDQQPLALSPDGRLLAFLGGSLTRPQIYLRQIGELESRVLAGTEGAHAPTFSPDGQWIAFLADGKLRKVRVTGGTPVVVTSVSLEQNFSTATMSWGDGNVIVFASWTPGVLWAVGADGGTPRQVTRRPTSSTFGGSHRHPHVLPGGRTVLFTEVMPDNRGRVLALDLPTHRVTPLVEDAKQPTYVLGRLLFRRRDGSLSAVPFDLSRMALVGRPALVAGGERYVASATGTLVYRSPPASPRALVLVGRDGAARPLPLPTSSSEVNTPRFARDGGRIAFTAPASVSGPRSFGRVVDDVWVQRLDSSPPLRLSARQGNFPAWSPDGLRLVFSAYSGPDEWDLFWQPADGGGDAEVLLARPGEQRDVSWGPDGSWLVFREREAGKPNDLMLLDLRGGRTVRPLVDSPADELMPAVSPDGRRLAYASDESGRYEVYVRAIAGSGRWQISTGGGTEPRWAPDGTRLFFWRGDEFMEAALRGTGTFEVGAVRLLFRGPDYLQSPLATNYDVHPDGQRFAMTRAASADRVVVVLNALADTR